MFKYIQFQLFLKSSFVHGDAISVKYEDIARTGTGPKTPEQKSDTKEDLSHLSSQDQERVEKIKAEYQQIKAGLSVVGKREEILRTRLLQEGDPKDKEFKEVANRIQELQGELKDLGVQSSTLQKELSTFLGEVQTEIRKISPEENKELQKIDNKEFLQIPAEKRLQYINKAHTDSSEVVNGSVKSLEFSFSFDGKINQELYKYTTAGQVLPKEIREISSGGEKFERIGVNGEFYNKDNKRLTIHEGTQVNIDKLGDKEELSKIEKESLEKYNKFIDVNPKYKEEQYTDAIKEMYNKGLGDEDVLLVLNFSYKELEKLDKTQAEKLLVVTRHLDNSGFLDDFMDAGEIITKLEEILAVLRQYGQNLKYKMNDKGEIKFDLNEKGLPEGLESMPGLEKFRQIALSQLGTTEHNGGANKYFSETGFGNIDARNTPWCAAFINRCLKMSGFEGTHSMAAKSFIKGEGFGHVGIKLGDKILGGNQGDKVSIGRINKPIVGYAIPTENGLEIHKPAGDSSQIPDGAIIVFDRIQKDRHMA